MARTLSLVAASIVWLSIASTVAAASDPLAVIPDTALGLAVVNNLSDTSARVQKLTEKMQLPVPELLPMVQLYSGAQQGVDVQGTLAAAVFPDDHEDATFGMSLAVFVPVTDYKVFVSQLQPDDVDATICEVNLLGDKYLATKKGDFAVLAATSQKYVLEQVQAATANVAATLKPLRPWLEQQQAAIVVTPAGKKLLVTKLGEYLDEALKAAEETKDSDDAKTGDDDAKPAADTMKSLNDMMRSIQGFVGSSRHADDAVWRRSADRRLDGAACFGPFAVYARGRVVSLGRHGQAARRGLAGRAATRAICAGLRRPLGQSPSESVQTRRSPGR